MIKKLLVCSALIALGSSAENGKWSLAKGRPLRFRKNQAASALLQASQDDVVQDVTQDVGQDVVYGQDFGQGAPQDYVYGQDFGQGAPQDFVYGQGAPQDFVYGQDVGYNLVGQVIFPFVQNLDNLDTLERSGRLQTPQDIQNLLNTLMNLRYNLETLQGVQSAVSSVGNLQDPRNTALLENTQDTKTLTDLISKIVNPLIKNLNGLFGKKTAPVLLESGSSFFNTLMTVLDANKAYSNRWDRLFRRSKTEGFPALLENTQDIQTISDLLDKVINPAIQNLQDSLRQNFPELYAPSLVESKNKWSIAQLWKELAPKLKRKNQETPALLQAQRIHRRFH